MDEKEKIVKIAEAVILNYVKGNYSDKKNFEQEMQRIKKICKRLNISFENIMPGSPTRATNHGQGKLTFRFADKENVSEDELANALGILVHEIYHSISKTNIGNLFLEEGYVTYITSETIRYAIDNPIEIQGEDTEELKALLQKQNLENGYVHASEFARCTQLIMEQYGIDSKYEYIFNGFNRLKEVVKEVSSEFGKIMELQNKKETNSPNLIIERKFFKEAFEKIDFSNISPTLVEMNGLLQEYLIESKEINKNQRVYDSVSQFNPQTVAYEEFYLDAKNISDDEILARVYDTLPKQSINYQQYDDIAQAVRQMANIGKIYKESSSAIKPAIYGGINFYSILIAYDIYQKGIELPSEQDVMKYCKRMIFNANLEKITVNTVFNYIEYVRIKCDEGKDLRQILNENLANNTVLSVNMRKISESEQSEWNKVNQMADLIVYQREENQEDFYYFWYERVLKMDSKHSCDQEGYDKFIAKMQDVFDRIQMPETMSKIGCTPEMIFIKTVSDNLDVSSNDFAQQVNSLLKIINDKSPNLGIATGKLDDLGIYASMAYEKLKESGNKELLKEFSKNLLISFAGKGNNSKLRQATYTEVRNRAGRTDFRTNKSIEKIFNEIIATPEFYQDLNEIKEMFDKYPDIYTKLFEISEFGYMLVKQLPGELQAKAENGILGYVSMIDIKNAIFGCRFPQINQFTTEKLADVSPILQFFVKYDTYQQLVRQNKKEEAQKLFAENKTVLNRTTVVTMAKNPDVQICQTDAHEAFGELESVKSKEIKQKDIS